MFDRFQNKDGKQRADGADSNKAAYDEGGESGYFSCAEVVEKHGQE